MNIQLASHYGMCFGVRDAVELTQKSAAQDSLTVLGQLVHNPVVSRKLDELGAAKADLQTPGSAATEKVVITAHGASSGLKQQWAESGHKVIDTTCPLVKKAHNALDRLVEAGYHPVVVGTAGHVEVRGLIGDYPQAHVISNFEDAAALPFHPRLGIVSQTTQPIRFVQEIVAAVQARHPESEVRFIDTVCQPTKERQTALDTLCRDNETIVVVGGNNSNNTRQLLERARALGCTAYQVETAADLDRTWFHSARNVGLTAGTSTLSATVQEVFHRLQEFAHDSAEVSEDSQAGIPETSLATQAV